MTLMLAVLGLTLSGVVVVYRLAIGLLGLRQNAVDVAFLRKVVY
jgi:hypothetical protein